MTAFIKNTLKAPLFYLREKLSPRQFFILSSIVVGILSGLAAILLKSFVHSIAAFVNRYADNYEGFFMFALLPLIGILLTVLYIKYILKDNFKKGSAEIVYAIAKKSSILPTRQTHAHIVTSALTVGFGGSTGLESPLVSTGSAIGSSYGRSFELSYKEKTILLACGASAGIAAAFNAPIAGVLFAIEVLLTDISASAFIPLIIAAASGALLSKIFLSEGVILSFYLQAPFNYHNIHYYILLGVIAGMVSLYYARTFEWIEKKMKSITNRWTRVIAGGLLLFLLLIFFPPLFGEGYESIKLLADLKPEELIKSSVLFDFIKNDIHLLIFLGILVFLKAIATAITLGSGGNGGSFGPSLFVGAYLGFSFARTINISGITTIPETNFTLVAMAGILSGVFYAPLTAIFLIAEITGGYELMIPLMIVAALSYIVVHYFEPLSMEARKLSEKLKLSVDDRDKYLLSKLELQDLIEKNFTTINVEDSLLSLVKGISKSKRNTFPVVNDKQELQGLIHLDYVRDVIFNAELYEKISIKDLMKKPPAVISVDDNLHTVLKKFDETKQWTLPVVNNKKYLGFVSKSSVLSQYREELLKSI